MPIQSMRQFLYNTCIQKHEQAEIMYTGYPQSNSDIFFFQDVYLPLNIRLIVVDFQ